MSYLKYDGSAAAETAAPVTNLSGVDGVVDSLVGTAAADAFWGGDGDLMTGGLGSDTYYLKSTADRVVELAGGGTDKIVAWSNVYLARFANVENLEVDGDKSYGAGNSGDNIIQGGAGSQQLYGGFGQDVLAGGSGADTFIVVKGQGNDVIQDFNAGEDSVRLSAGYSTFAQVQSHLSQVGADVKLDMGGADGLIFRNLTVSQLTASNFQLQLDTSKLGAMTFHDEFSGALSIYDKESNAGGVWRTDFGYQGTQGVGSYSLVSNDEKQIYTSPYFRDHNGDFADTPFVSNADGTLSIVARPSTNSEIFGYHYTSGMISTSQTFAQTYGYFEMRADIPSAAGAWPAFWLLPADGSWPPELDVMETLTSDPNSDWTTEHSGIGGHTSNGVASFIPDTADGFHTYGVMWTQTDLTWYVDGVATFHTATPADMNKPMYMIANLALGGWGGAIDAAALPAEMKIDYIRAYGLGADGGVAAASGPPVTTTAAAAAAPVAATVAPMVPIAATSLGVTVNSNGFGSTLAGGAGADTLSSFQGNETMTGGDGADVFQFKTMPWNPSHITDFHVGVDRIDVSSLYIDGYNGTDPIADGHAYLIYDGHGGTAVCIDVDGRATGHLWGDYVVDIEGVLPTNLTSAQLFGGPAATVAAPPVAAAAAPPPVAAAAGGVVLTASWGPDTLTGGAGADTLNASRNPDQLTGGAGADRFVYGEVPWSPGHVTDFTHGQDLLDLRGVFKNTGYTGTDPVADHYLSFISDGAGGTKVLFDDDGANTAHPWPNYIITLDHIQPGSMTAADWIIR